MRQGMSGLDSIFVLFGQMPKQEERRHNFPGANFRVPPGTMTLNLSKLPGQLRPNLTTNDR